MKIATQTLATERIFGYEKAIELIAKAGFDAWDFSMGPMCGYDWETKKAIKTNHPLSGNDYLAYARKLKRIGLDNGIVCNQSHAPFPTGCDEIRTYFKRAIECTAEAGGNICIIHPDNDKGVEENAEMYFELLPFAKECGVKIATENMWNWDDEKDHACFAACGTAEDFCAHLNAVNDDYLIACLDIGHAEMKGCNTSAVEMINALGPKLQALHIHDNDKWHDLHQIPFSGEINFDEVIKALKDNNYSGYLTLEADCYLDKYTQDNFFEGLKDLAASVKKLADMFEGKNR